MAVAAQPQSADYPMLRPRPSSRGATYRTAVLTTVAVIVGALVISGLLTISMVLAEPPRAWDSAPLSQPLPQPSAAYGLDL
jgi:hypothetical protein